MNQLQSLLSSRIGACVAAVLWLMPTSGVAQDADEEQTDVSESVKKASEVTDQAANVASSVSDRAAEQTSEVESKTRQLTLFAASNTGGSLATPRCRKSNPTPPEELHYARLVQSWNELVAEAQQADRPEPIAFHLGDSTYPGPVGRFLLARDVAPEGSKRLVSLLARIPYVAHMLGNAEIGLEPTVRSEFLGATSDAEFPIRAANLVCTSETGGEAVCEAIGAGPKPTDKGRYDTFERNGLRVAVVSLLDPAITDRVAKSRMAGLEILSPESQLSQTVEQIQKGDDDVDVIVAQFHAADDRSHARTMQLAQSVDGVDVVLTNAELPGGSEPITDGRSQQNGYAVVPGTGTIVVGMEGGPQGYVIANLTMAKAQQPGDANESKNWAIQQVDSRAWTTKGVKPDPETASALTDVAKDFCGKWGKPVSANATLTEPMDRSAFQRYVLNTMRFSAEAEVALINDGAIANAATFPIREKLTLAEIYTALPYNNELVVARVKGSKLAEWANKLESNLNAVGLTKDGKVNGRAIRPGRRYLVAVNKFVREGGDGLVEPDAFMKARQFNPGWSDGAPPISEIVVHYIESGAFEQRGAVAGRIDPTGNFPDLTRKLFWAFTGSLNASYNQVLVSNPGGEYTQSQLTNNNTRQVNVEFTGVANADSRNHGWDNSLQIQYARAQVSQDGQQGNFEQTKDLIRGKSAYKFTGIRANLGNAWWAPIPTAELQVETEFDAPDERDPQWHKLELTGIAGLSFQLFEPFEVTVGANMRGDVNAPDSETVSGPVSGLAASYQLNRIDLLPLIGSPVKFESELEYFYNDISRDDIHELRNSNRLYYSLFQDLYFTSTFSAFLYQNTRGVGELGSHTELTFGLNYLWDASVQTF